MKKHSYFDLQQINLSFLLWLNYLAFLPEYPLKKEGRETPLHFDEDASLSALLLDKDYYNILVHEKESIQGYSVLSNRGLIIFKAKAWLDMRETLRHWYSRFK